jgi:hypothetical protein
LENELRGRFEKSLIDVGVEDGFLDEGDNFLVAF